MIDVAQIFKNLLAQKRLFSNEADLQFALAWEIKTEYPDKKINLEYVPWKHDANMHIDIVVEDEGYLIPIELKYKTKRFSGEYNGDTVVLKNHSAYDQARYDFVKDIYRLENFNRFEKYKVGTGYAIFITNDHNYWKPTNKNGMDSLFRIYEGKEISGDIHWLGEPKKGTVKGRAEVLHLEGRYKIYWNSYHLTNDLEFRYTIVEIGKNY